eukprot:6213292-Pleurochrysis_carterae.AAC.1
MHCMTTYKSALLGYPLRLGVISLVFSPLYSLLPDVYRVTTRHVMCMHGCLLSGMYVVIYIHFDFITPPSTHAATPARTHATARRPQLAVAQRARPDRGTRLRQLACTRVFKCNPQGPKIGCDSVLI